MRKDLRPYWVKKSYLVLRRWYVDRFLRPKFASLGGYGEFMSPRHIIINGDNISLGRSATVVAEPYNPVNIGVWGDGEGKGEISIGDCAMISPGVRISAANRISIGDSCMMANGVYVTDSDWHGLYDRVGRDEAHAPVNIGDNVWLGDHATVLKGVTSGDNSVVAAGAVGVKDVPANVVVAGNPAKVVKELDPEKPMRTRGDFYHDPAEVQREYDDIDRMVLHGNSFWRWLLSVLYPGSRRWFE